jgi:opacity protein-like surface antigen
MHPDKESIYMLYTERKMVNAFNKYCLALSSALLLNTMADSLVADAYSHNEDSRNCNDTNKNSHNCNRLYLGAFGGGIYSDGFTISQMGTALFPEAVGGPLAVEARGHAKKNSAGFGGLQLGYEWSKCVNKCSKWAVAPGAEIEAYWLTRRHIKGHLFNATDTDRLPEHDFLDTFHMGEGVFLANFLLSLNNTWRISPYVGAGVGATRISLHKADSLQVAPPEAGINHFNSRTHDSSWAFAAQIKAGLRYNVWKFHFFGEYRYLYVDFSNYIFGSTVYPTHAHTTPWNVKIPEIQYNAFVFGVQFDLY